MFYRSMKLDSQAENGIKALEAIYKQIHEVLAKMPDSKASTLAETYLQQSYMWAVCCIEDSSTPAPTPAAPTPAAPTPAAPTPAAPTPVFPSLQGLVEIPSAPVSDSEILAKSTKELDALMQGIKDLTSKVRTSGLSF